MVLSENSLGPTARSNQAYYRKIAVSTSSLILLILLAVVFTSYKSRRDDAKFTLGAETTVLSGIELNPPFKLPILRWHDSNQNLLPFLHAPRGLSESTRYAHKKSANAESTNLHYKVKERNTFTEKKLVAMLHGLHVSEKNIANIISAMKKKTANPTLSQNIAMMAAEDNPLENSMIIEGGDAQESDEPDLLDMIAVLEGLHVSSQVIDDSVNAVRAHLVLPKDIIKIATTVKEQQVQRFLDAQADMERAVDDMKEKKFGNHDAALSNATRASETANDPSQELNKVLAAAKAAVSAARDAQRVRAQETRRRRFAATNLTFAIPPLPPPNGTASATADSPSPIEDISRPVEETPDEPPAPGPEPPAPGPDEPPTPGPEPPASEPEPPAEPPTEPAEQEPAPTAPPEPGPSGPAAAEPQPPADSPPAPQDSAEAASSAPAEAPAVPEAASSAQVPPAEAPAGGAGESSESSESSGSGADSGTAAAGGWTLQPFAGTSAARAVIWRRVPRKLLPGVPALPWRPLWQTAPGPQNYTAGGTFRHFDGRLMRVLNVTRTADGPGARGAVVLPSLGGGWVLQDAGLLHGNGPDPDDAATPDAK